MAESEGQAFIGGERMTEKDIDTIVKILCPNDEDFEKPIISPKYLKQELEQLALEQEPCEDVVRKDCDKCAYYDNGANDEACNGCFEDEEHLNFKPKAQYCDDCISREAVYDLMAMLLSDYLHDEDREKIEFIDAKIAELPSVTPNEKTGHWTRVTDKTGHLVWECGCGWQQRFNTNFCPDCGARMVEL